MWAPRLSLAEVRIYTKKGDDGTTGLLYGGRVSKADPATEAYGSVNRSVVIGDTVYMLSDRALQANSLDTHRETGKLIL